MLMALGAGAALAAVASSHGAALAYLLPPFLLLIALASRRYPGERVLLGLIARRTRPRRRCLTLASPRLRPRCAVPRGGRLIASSLAVRPPPAAAALSLA